MILVTLKSITNQQKLAEGRKKVNKRAEKSG
jgi:hypothetical protein